MSSTEDEEAVLRYADQALEDPDSDNGAVIGWIALCLFCWLMGFGAAWLHWGFTTPRLEITEVPSVSVIPPPLPLLDAIDC